MLKKISPTLFFFIFILIYFLPYFRVGLPVTHDGENHVARFAQYYLALKQGQFPPRLAPTLPMVLVCQYLIIIIPWLISSVCL